MLRAKQASKRKHRGKAVPVLGAAGLSLSLASGVSAATSGSTADMLMRNIGVSHQITLCEEEVFDVSLATFYVFDKENAGTFRRGVRLAAGGGCGGCAGCAGCATGAPSETSTLGSKINPPHYSIMPTRTHTQAAKRKHVPRNPEDARIPGCGSLQHPPLLHDAAEKLRRSHGGELRQVAGVAAARGTAT